MQKVEALKATNVCCKCYKSMLQTLQSVLDESQPAEGGNNFDNARIKKRIKKILTN